MERRGFFLLVPWKASFYFLEKNVSSIFLIVSRTTSYMRNYVWSWNVSFEGFVEEEENKREKREEREIGNQ